MSKARPLGVRLISYYNMILSIAFIFGSASLIVFIKTNNPSERSSLLPRLVLLILLSLFYIFSAFKYLHQENIGRVCLICSCVAQILFSIHGLFSAYKSINSLPVLNIIVFLFASWGIWYLQTKESKIWATKKTE